MSSQGVFNSPADNYEKEVNGALDLFSVPAFDASMQSGSWIVLNPMQSIENAPYEFQVSINNPQDFLFMPLTKLTGEVRICHGDSSPINENEDVSLVNNFIGSLFRRVEIRFQDELVSDLSTPNSAYLDYLENALSYSKAAIDTNLECMLFDTEDAETNEFCSIKQDQKSTDLIRRNKKYVVGSKRIRFVKPLKAGADFLQCARLVPSGTTLKLRFERNDDMFSLISPDAHPKGYKIEILDLKLSVRRVTLRPEFARVLHQKWQKTSIKYPFVQSCARYFPLSKGTTLQNIINVTQNLPNVRQLIIGFFDSSGYNSDGRANPFHSSPFDVSSIQLTYDGREIKHGTKTLEWDSEEYVNAHCEGYASLIENTGVHFDNMPYGFGMEHFRKTHFFVSYDMSSYLNNGVTLESEPPNASFDLNITFKTPLKQNINAIVFISRNCLLELHSNGANGTGGRAQLHGA